ncbi:MAG: DUF3450 domain-containing protein [Lentisphaerales bacterium]|nr:DUF3450 domain-containing protein [Lentisphaerales bacterium]
MKRIFILFLLLFGGVAFAEERERLIEALDKLNELHRTISKEKAEWQEEKKTLELHLQLVKDSLQTKSAGKVELEKILEELQKKKSEFAAKTAEVEKALKALEVISKKSAEKVLAEVHPKIPESLQALVQKEADELKAYSSDKDANVMDVLSASREYFSAVLELQKKVHLLKEVVSVAGQKQQITALFVGTYTGYYLTQDCQSAGQLVFDGQWKAKEDNSLLASIKTAISQYNREGKPVLVNLPVRGGVK